MSKQELSITRRIAIWRAHGTRCVYCTEHVRFADLWIEHIIPEYLLEKPNELQRVIEEYDLGYDFNVNGLSNLLPCHAQCNRKKGKTIFEKQAAHYYLTIAKRESAKAKQEEERALNHITVDKLLSDLGVAIEKGLVTKEELKTHLDAFHNYLSTVSQEAFEPFVITFGLTIDEVFDGGLLKDDVPTYYPALCDWLEKDLISQLTSIISGTFYYLEVSARNGETLLVRLAFTRLDLNELDKFSSPWWNILEIAYYSEIYDISDDWFTE